MNLKIQPFYFIFLEASRKKSYKNMEATPPHPSCTSFLLRLRESAEKTDHSFSLFLSIVLSSFSASWSPYPLLINNIEGHVSKCLRVY